MLQVANNRKNLFRVKKLSLLIKIIFQLIEMLFIYLIRRRAVTTRIQVFFSLSERHKSFREIQNRFDLQTFLSWIFRNSHNTKQIREREAHETTNTSLNYPSNSKEIPKPIFYVFFVFNSLSRYSCSRVFNRVQ